MRNEPPGPHIGRRHGAEQGRSHARAGGDPRPWPNLFGALAVRGYLAAFEAAYARSFADERAEIEAARKREERRRKRAGRQTAPTEQTKGPRPMLEDHGRRRGFDDGYRDACENKREKPSPSIGAALLSPTYLDAYTRAYHEGYADAARDIAILRRRKAVREAERQSHPGKTDPKPTDDRASALLAERLKRDRARGQERDKPDDRSR